MLLNLAIFATGCMKVTELTGITGVCPIVISTDPADSATGVDLNQTINASFNEPMNPATINATTFTLKQGVTAISGTVTYTGITATFTPSGNLVPNTIYTATISTGSKDPAGNALIDDYVWNFTTWQLISPSFLGSASLFGVFGGSAGTTNQGLNTVINNGGIGTTAVPTSITGFHDATTGTTYTETILNVGNVTGGVYTGPPSPGTPASLAIATKALADANNAYDSISPASRPGGTDPGAGELGGLTLLPGIYKSASGTFKITTGNLTLDAANNPNAVWIFQAGTSLTVGIAGPAGARSVILVNGASPNNVYWYIGSAATINGTGGGTMVGTIIASAGVTFSTAGNSVQTVLNGRAISLNASVTMVNTTINVP
jgi:Ice-binding-like/Bacterial Ig-like domain